jgi:hypothetical protein
MENLKRTFDELILSDADQKSQDWHEIRRGRFTSSEFHKLLTKPQSKAYGDANEGFGKTAVEYIGTKAMEIVTGEVLGDDKDSLFAIEWGNTFEPSARKFYELMHGDTVETCGFYPFGKNAGGSLDGKSRKVGVVEIKCPSSRAVHSKYLRMIKTLDDLRDVNDAYWTQIQCNMFFTGIPSAAFISFDPRYCKQAWTPQDWRGFSPEYAFESATDYEKKLALHVVTGDVDKAFTSVIEETISRAVRMRDRMVEELQTRFGVK